jgi:hyperosmotically inducible protein
MHKFQITLIFVASLITVGCGSLGLGSGSGDRDGGSSANSLTGSRNGPKVSDSDITAAIKEAFKEDTELAAANLSVNSDNGIVTLSGNVPNAQSYNRALSLARNTQGVRPPVKASGLKFPQ